GHQRIRRSDRRRAALEARKQGRRSALLAKPSLADARTAVPSAAPRAQVLAVLRETTSSRSRETDSLGLNYRSLETAQKILRNALFPQPNRNARPRQDRTGN